MNKIKTKYEKSVDQLTILYTKTY